jgi:flagellum-specific ATP synthase
MLLPPSHCHWQSLSDHGRELSEWLAASQSTLQPVTSPLYGRITRVTGTTIEAQGLTAPVGAQCDIGLQGSGERMLAEVVGFVGDTTVLIPFQSVAGLSPGARITMIEPQSSGGLSPELIGRVVDGFGEPLDGRGAIRYQSKANLEGAVLNPMERGPIREVLDTGIKAINTALTIGRGQRIGLIAGSGVGKSVLLGMLTRNTEADVVVIALIGERGREVKDFINETLGKTGLERAVVVAAPANVSPVERIRAAKLSHLICEYFREQGKHVLLLFDSLTRVAHAQREIGLASGEPPTTKGYPPSVFSTIPNFIERPGVGRGGRGSITSFYTVLAEGDDRNDPIVDISRASLDGQIMLTRQLADAAHYPAIDLAGSISRVANSLLEPGQVELAQRLRRLWTLYTQKQDFINVGAYEANSNPELDEAIRYRRDLSLFLQQVDSERVPFSEGWRQLGLLFGGRS